MSINIIIEDEFGTHELKSDSDCICIVDDGKGNIEVTEDCCDDIGLCENCERFCNELDYCIYEGE